MVRGSENGTADFPDNEQGSSGQHRTSRIGIVGRRTRNLGAAVFQNEMIIAFANNFTARIFRDPAEANAHCDSIEVEDGVFTFLDDTGHVLEPVFTRRSRREKVGVFTRITSGSFTLAPSTEIRRDLLRKLALGEIMIERGPTEIQNRQDLKRIAPGVFLAANE